MAGPNPDDLSLHVRVLDDPALATAIERHLGEAPGPLRVSVTDLIDPRPAFFRLTRAVPVSPEQAERWAEGRERHDRYERALALPTQREVQLLREGVHGRVDVWDGGPTELKTTAALSAPERTLVDRPQYLEQLAVYCALADRPEGRLVVVAEPTGEAPQVQAFACTFGPAGPLWERTRERAERFREALARQDPAGLPRCGWFGRGCEVQRAGLCGCTGAEPAELHPGREFLRSARFDPELSRQLADRLAAPPVTPQPFGSYRELCFPLRAYFETVGPQPAAVPPEPAPAASPLPGRTFYQEIRDVLEGLGPGEVTRVLPEGDVPTETIQCFRGAPVIVKTTRSPYPPRSAALPRDRPHQMLEVGLRAAALGTTEGILIVGYERLALEDGPVRAHRRMFEPAAYWAELLARRRDGLRRAIAQADPTGLPVCPSWMCTGCPYRATCGDGAAATAGLRQR
jgi:hypothetical protein